MTDDQFWRLVIGGSVTGLLVGLRPQISRLLERAGYTGYGLTSTPTGWRRGLLTTGIAIGIVVIALALS